MNSTSGQIHKNLRGDPSFDTKVVFIRENSPASCARSVARLVDSIPVNESILFLSRFRHDIVSLENGGFRWKPDVGGRTFTVTRTNSDRKITFMTIHGSKGIQADHVFILNNKRGPGGFPDMRGESILIKSLLNGHGDKLADERRLFYVALTRARKSVHLVSLNGSESEYLKECVYYLKVK